MYIGYIGLSHLGLVSSVTSAQKGFHTICYDNNYKLIEKIKNHKIAIVEPKLVNLIKKNKKKLIYTDDPKYLNKCDIIYLSQDIKTDNNNISDLKEIKNLIKTTISYLKKDAIIVILCQVEPGFTRQINWPAKQLYYQVETLIFGKAISRSLYPERIIIGSFDPNKKINKKFKNYLNNFNCPILNMKYESAELAKISINLLLISSIITSNKIAEICSKIEANWSEIIPALRLDKRIGKYAYIKPGLGISGGNLERDLNTIINLSKKNNVNKDIFLNWKKNIIHMRNWVWRELLKYNKSKNKKISILGLTYKENTNSIKNSASIDLIKKLKKNKIKAYDPAASKEINFNNLERCQNPIAAISGTDILIIMTPWPEFKLISSMQINKIMRGKLIIDPYNLFEKQIFRQQGIKYISIGENNNVNS